MINKFIASFVKSYLFSYQGLPSSCWKGILLSFIEATLAGVYYFISIYLLEILHFNIATTSMIMSFYGLGTIVGGLVGGKLCDKIPPIWVITFGLFLQAVAFFSLTLFTTLIPLSIDLFVLGIATYYFITANHVWVLSYIQENEINKIKAISMLNVTSNLGIGFSAVIIGMVARHHFNYLFYFSSCFLLILSITLPFTRSNYQNTSFHPREVKQQINKSKTPLHVLYMILICLFFTGMIVSQLSSTYPIFIKNAFPKFGIQAFSTLFTIMTLLIVIFQGYITTLVSGYNKILMIGFGSFCIGSGMLLLNFSYTFSIALLACVIYSMGEMLFFSMVQLFCYQSGGNLKKGSSMGLYRTVYATSKFTGPIAGGFIYHHFSGQTLWYISGIIGITFLILCNFYKMYD